MRSWQPKSNCPATHRLGSVAGGTEPHRSSWRTWTCAGVRGAKRTCLLASFRPAHADKHDAGSPPASSNSRQRHRPAAWSAVGCIQQRHGYVGLPRCTQLLHATSGSNTAAGVWLFVPGKRGRRWSASYCCSKSGAPVSRQRELWLAAVVCQLHSRGGTHATQRQSAHLNGNNVKSQTPVSGFLKACCALLICAPFPNSSR